MLAGMKRVPIGAMLGALALTACTGQIGSPSESSNDSPAATDSPGSTTTTTSGGDVPSDGTSNSSTSGGTGGPPVIDDDGDGAGEVITGSSCDQVGVDVGSSVLRRLSRIEYQLTLQDLLQLDQPPNVDAVPADVAQDGFTAFAEVQSISSGLLRAYLQVAEEQAAALFDDASRADQVIGCDTAQADCLEAFVSQFGERAYRRPLTQEELTGITSKAVEVGLDTEDQFRYAIEVMLGSPSFLFRVEVGDTPDGLSNLSAREVASRLSFATWGRAPSLELLARADNGELDSPEGLLQVANEMLDDPRAEVFFQTFFREWLNYDEMRPPKNPPADWDDALMTSMQNETDAFLREFAWTPATDFLSALSANHTYVTPELATFYGLPSPASDGRVEFPAGSPRENAGLLAHASLLSAKSDGDSVALRGNWLRSTFLCEKLYIDAEQLNAIGEELVGLTRMEIIDERNKRAQCVGCHGAIDPIGVGFEQFDATGRFDDSVDLSSYPVAPAFPDADDPSFESVPQLAQKLAGMPEVAACLSSRVFLYANGRSPSSEDACAVEQATTEFIRSQHAFSNILLGLIEAPAFRLRRPPAAP